MCHPNANGKREDRYGQEQRRSFDSVQRKVKHKRCNKTKAVGSETPELDPQFRAGLIVRFSLICQVDTRRLGRRKLRYEFNAVQRLYVGAWIELLIGENGEIRKIALYELSHEASDIHWCKYDGRQTVRSDIADDAFHCRDQLAMQVGRQGQIGCAACLAHSPTDRILDFLRNEIGRNNILPARKLVGDVARQSPAHPEFFGSGPYVFPMHRCTETVQLVVCQMLQGIPVSTINAPHQRLVARLLVQLFSRRLLRRAPSPPVQDFGDRRQRAGDRGDLGQHLQNPQAELRAGSLAVRRTDPARLIELNPHH